MLVLGKSDQTVSARIKINFDKIFELQTINENLGDTLGTCKVIKTSSLDSYSQTVYGLQPHKAFFFGVDKKKILHFRNIDVTEVI